MYDCGFTKENNWFRYRAGAFIVKDNKILFVKSKIGEYYYILGGGVHLGETSKQCVEREVLEETGINAQAKRLAVVCENFFKGIGGMIDGLDCHTIEFYYIMQIQENEITLENKMTDDGEKLVWLPIEQIPNSEIKPAFVKDYIEEIISGENVLHIIEEKDR